MQKVVLYIATSLDGFIADINGGVDWLPQCPDPEDTVGFKALMNRISSIVMGSKSYQQILTFGPWAWPEKHTYVFTSQNLHAEQPSITFVHDTPKNFIQNLRTNKADRGNNNNNDIWLLGGAELIKSFTQENLIDEVIITLIPVYLKQGVPLYLNLHNFILTSTKICVDNTAQIHYSKRTQQ